MNVRVPPALVRLDARQVGRRVLNPRLPWEVQRRRALPPDITAAAGSALAQAAWFVARVRAHIGTRGVPFAWTQGTLSPAWPPPAGRT